MIAAPWSLARIAELRERVPRDRHQSWYVEGVRFVVAASDAGARFRSLVVCPRLLKNPVGQMVTRRLRASGVPALSVSPEAFAQLSLSPEPQGIGAVLAQEWTPIEAVRARPGDCWVVVADVRSPGNLGTLLRTAAATGARGLVCLRGGSADPFHPATSRAAMGALHGLQLIQAEATAFAAWCRRERVRIVGAMPQATADYRQLPAHEPLALFIGSERKGLSETHRALCHASVRIPMRAGDSLNLAVAGSLLLYEVWRLRHPVEHALSP